MTRRSMAHPSRRSWMVRGTAACAAAALCTGGVASAAAGDLDPTFGGDGRAEVAAPDLPEHYQFRTAGIDADDGGGVWVASTTFDGYTGSHGRGVITRLRADGTLDAGFAGDGQLDWTLSDKGRSPDTVLRSVDALPGGGVQVSGTWTDDWTPHRVHFLARLLPDGRVDRSYGERGGAVRHRAVDGWSAASALLPDTSTYQCVLTEDQSLRIWRNLPDGSPDTSFGRSGLVNVPLGDELAAVDSERIQGCGPTAGGGVVAVLMAERDFDSVVALVRLRIDGKRLRSFGEKGLLITEPFDKLTTHLDGSLSNRVVIHSGGAVDFTGLYEIPNGAGGTYTYPAVAALRRDGSVDTGFGGGDGLAVALRAEIPGTYLPTIARSPDGSFVVTGAQTGGRTHVVRFTPTGELDPEFGDEGVVIDFWPGTSNGDAITVDAQGRPVVGVAGFDKHRMGLARLQP